MAKKAVIEGESASDVIPRIAELIEKYRIPISEATETAVSSLDNAASEKARKICLDPREFNNIHQLFCHYRYDFGDPANLEKRRFGYAYAAMSNVLWQVKQGTPPPYDGAGRAQFNLEDGETPVFCFGSTILAEERTVSNHGYAGVSVPVGDGIRFNTGTYGGKSVTGLDPVDEGDFLMTDRSVYFGGKHTTFRIPYDTILRTQAYIDGIGVFQNYGVQKVFVQELHGGESGWFVNELVTTLIEQHKGRG